MGSSNAPGGRDLWRSPHSSTTPSGGSALWGKLMDFKAYCPSPLGSVSLDASPSMSVVEKLTFSGIHAISHVPNPFADMGMSDMGFVDDSVEKLKYVLGRHLFDTLRR